jgi:hypothetical protein
MPIPENEIDLDTPGFDPPPWWLPCPLRGCRVGDAYGPRSGAVLKLVLGLGLGFWRLVGENTKGVREF